MDDDLEQMSRGQLIAEVNNCGPAFVSAATAHCMIFAGTIQRSGAFCLRRPILFPLFRRGPSSCKGV
jgi:hypothetical protein